MAEADDKSALQALIGSSLTVTDVQRNYIGAGQLDLHITLQRPDGTQFQVASQVFSGQPDLAKVAAMIVGPKSQRTNAMASTRLPNLSSIPERIRKFEAGLEDRAQKFLSRVDGSEGKADNTFTRANASIDKYESNLTEVDNFLEEINKATNGPPSPLSGSGS